MTIDDQEEFCELWLATLENLAGGKVLSGAALEMVFEDLEEFSLEEIRAALKKHRKTAKFAPTPSDIIQIINDSKGVPKHLGVEEAWARALPMMGDEFYSYVVTHEILEAKALAEPVFLAGDKFSAARVFKEKYLELTKTDLHAPKWFVSLGDDTQSRISATNEARRLNLISDKQAETLKLGLDKPETTVEKLTKEAQKRIGSDSNVIDLSEEIRKRTFAELHSILNGKAISLEKSPSLLAIRHDKWLRKQHKKQLEQLMQQYPEQFEREKSEDLANA